MGRLMIRVKGRIDRTLSGWKQDSQFSRKLAVYRMIDELAWRLHFRRLSNFFHSKKDQWILEYLETKSQDIIEKYKFKDNCGEEEDNGPIWICWWTGEDTAPVLVKQCIKSIRKSAKLHPVYFIDRNNYSDYLQIPEFILRKVNNGKMCVANFSDYLRFSLLEKYGGLWLDATIFCAKDIPEEYFQIPMFTCKSNPIQGRYISQYRWTSFCLGGWKHSVCYQFLKEMMENYWKTEESSVDYLLVDYLINIAYSNNSTVKRCLDSVPLNNLKRDELQAAMNTRVSGNELNDILDDETILYKLSWREKYSLTAVNGDESIYSYFLNLKI